MLAALGAAGSWLCCLPIALGTFGASGAALANFLGPLRPYITVLSVALMAAALFEAYRPRKATCDDGSCDLDRNVRRKRGFLWLALGAVVLLLTLPRWASWVIYWSL